MTPRVRVARWRLGWSPLPWVVLAAALPAFPQTIEYAPDPASATTASETPVPAISTAVELAPVVVPLNEQRILGVMPDYQTVRDTSRPVAPLTSKEKWLLAWKETVDPFNIATAFMTAAESQAGNQTPKFGEGGANYGRRVGAALADFGTQNFFSAGVLANVFHQDPRYFRKGPQSRFLPRILYAITRLAITPQDSGRPAFNISNFGGMALGIAASNAYYPAASVRGSVMAGRVGTSLMGGAVGDLMSEFWPDVQQKYFRWLK